MTIRDGESHVVLFLEMMVFYIYYAMDLYFWIETRDTSTPNSKWTTIIGDIPHEEPAVSLL